MAAWYPWKALDGELMSDSCGIFFVNKPAYYNMNKDLENLHNDDETGILYRPRPCYVEGSSPPAVAGTNDTYDRIDSNAGPGQPLRCYLPKVGKGEDETTDTLRSKLYKSLFPSKSSLKEQHKQWDDIKTHRGRHERGIEFRQKRSSVKKWECNGVHNGGTHFPLLCFTNNVGRRSPEKLQDRKERRRRRFARQNEWWDHTAWASWQW